MGIISSSYVNSNWSYSWVVTSVTLTFDFWPWPFCMGLTLVLGDNFWKFHDDTRNIVKKVWQTGRPTDRQTDRQSDRRAENTIHRVAWSQLKTMCIYHWIYGYITLSMCAIWTSYRVLCQTIIVELRAAMQDNEMHIFTWIEVIATSYIIRPKQKLM